MTSRLSAKTIAARLELEETQRAERRAATWNLYTGGMSYRDILTALTSERIETSMGTIATDVKQAREEFRAEYHGSILDSATDDLARLHRATLAVMPRAVRGDLRAVDRLLKIVLVRSRILGYGESEGGGHIPEEGFELIDNPRAEALLWAIMRAEKDERPVPVYPADEYPALPPGRLPVIDITP